MTECVIWNKSRTKAGYGRVWVNGKHIYAHRLAYEAEKGVIPEGMVIDHLCRNRACVNVDHMEVVTAVENTRRGRAGHHMKEKSKNQTHCKHGHEYNSENVYTNPQGRRSCRICTLNSKRKWRKEQ